MKVMVVFNERRKNPTFSRYGAPGFQTGGLILRSISFEQQALKTQDSGLKPIHSHESGIVPETIIPGVVSLDRN